MATRQIHRTSYIRTSYYTAAAFINTAEKNKIKTINENFTAFYDYLQPL